jgi:outer membrane lipoprotein-sorting protein
MNLRTISSRRLAALVTSAVAVAAGGTAIAVAGGSDPVPPPKPLAEAVHDGLTAPEVKGVTARVKFTNKLIDSSAFHGANPLLAGATGRLWLSDDHRLRLELQSENGDAQIVADKDSFWLYDSRQNTVYRGEFPAERGHKRDGAGRAEKRHGVPSIAKIQRKIDKAKRRANVSGADPTSVAGQPAYSVRVGPKRHPGLVGGAELAWDAVRGVPLRAGIYARGVDEPVVELTATDITYGPVEDSAFDVQPPAGAKTEDVTKDGKGSKGHRGHKGKHGKGAKHGRSVTGAERVAKKLKFQLSAPDTLADRQLSEVHLIKGEKGNAALVTYGKGLDGIAVIERKSSPSKDRRGASGNHHDGLELPTVSIDGVDAELIDTPLGSVLTFDRAGVSYTVVGSVRAAVVEAAARGL